MKDRLTDCPFVFTKNELPLRKKEKIMPSSYNIPNLSDEFNFWGARVFNNVKKNFVFMDINRSKSNRGTGDLYRSIFWKVYYASGGNNALVKFFYMKYGDFVEWGVGRGVKKWDVPPMEAKEPIKHPVFNRRAKAFIRSEVRRNIKWLQKRLGEEYCYFAEVYFIKRLYDTLDDPTPTIRWVKENVDKLGRDFRKFPM